MLCSFHKNGPEIEFSEIAKIWLDKFRKMKYNNSRKSRHATVAQLVEQLIRNQQVAGSSPATSSINRAGFRLVILRGLFLCFLYKNSSALLCFSQQGACFVDYSFVFSVSGASSAEVFFVWGWGSSFTTGIKRLANLFLPRLRT